MSPKEIGRKPFPRRRFHELDGVVSLCSWGGRRRDTGGSSHAPDGAQEAEVRGLATRGTQRRPPTCRIPAVIPGTRPGKGEVREGDFVIGRIPSPPPVMNIPNS